MMGMQHPQERIIKTFDYNGIIVDLIEWSDTIWCGKVGYADNNTDEPNVERIMEDFMSISAVPNARENDWDICMSLNYLSDQRSSGVMFGFLVSTDIQPDVYDVLKISNESFCE